MSNDAWQASNAFLWTGLFNGRPETNVKSFIADGFKLDVLLDIRQKSHSADYQGIRGPREVGEEKVKDVEINLVVDGNFVFDSYSWTLWRAPSS